MPYRKISSLPKGVKHLPKKAQEIYMEAFNNAYKQYKDPKKRRYNASLEETACRVAWNAVKKSYIKNEEGEWVKKN